MTVSPFVISTRELGRQPGAMEKVETTATSDIDLGNQVIAVPAGSPVELDLRLEAVMEGVLVTGVARAAASGECVRCLRPVSAELAVDITELFVYPGRRHPDAQEEDEGGEPLPEVHADTVDLKGTVIDALVTSLPLRPLCDPGCPGLCPECGIRLEDAEPDHGHETIDPRWAALAALAGLDEDDAAATEGDDETGDGTGAAEHHERGSGSGD